MGRFRWAIVAPSRGPAAFLSIIRPLPHAVNCVRFCFGDVCDFFVCVWNISGSAKRICDEFTWKTCLVPRWDEFEGQGQFRQPACGLCLENIFALVFCTFRSDGLRQWSGSRYRHLLHARTLPCSWPESKIPFLKCRFVQVHVCQLLSLRLKWVRRRSVAGG